MPLSEKDVHIGKYFQEAKYRAQEKNVPFTITLKYLRDSAGEYCPVFGHKFVWGSSGLGKGKTTGDSPSLDRIIPELGYVPGNVVFISHDANRIKNNATEKELYAVADWLHKTRKEVLKNVAAQQSTSVSDGANQQSEADSKRRALLAARLREDRDDSYHHCGTVSREDLDHSAQARSRNSVATGNKEVDPSVTVTRIENNGDTDAEIIRLDFSRRHLSD